MYHAIFILVSIFIHFVIINSQDVQILIMNGLLVTGEEGIESFLGHILIGKNGKILSVLRETGNIGNELKEKYPNSEIIDAKEKIVIPGGVDPGVKFNYLEGKYNIETSDDFYTGTIAAVCGGTTTVIDVVESDLNERETLVEALKNKLEDGDENSVADYSFHMIVNCLNYLDIEVPIRTTIYKYGVNTFKFDTYTEKPKLTKEEMKIAFSLLKKFGGLAIINCEEEELIRSKISECSDEDRIKPKTYELVHSPESERNEILDIINMAKEIGFPQGIHISHISSDLALRTIKDIKRQGFIATTEVTPHHLILTNEVYDIKNNNAIDYIVCPPLRTKNDIEKLWKGLNEGIIDFVVSDHSPFTKEQKRGKRTKPDYRLFYNKDLSMNKTFDTTSEKWTKKNPELNEIPQGFAGVETRMILMYHYGVVQKKISLEKYVEVTSTNAAKRYGLYPKKGILQRGSDADIVIIDPNDQTKIKAEKLHHNTNFCPYEDMTVNGRIKTIFIRGNKLFDNYQMLPSLLTHKGNMIRRMRYFLGEM